MKKRNVFLSIIFSLLCPGLGQLYNGKHIRFLIILFIHLLLPILFYNFLLKEYWGIIFSIVLSALFYLAVMIDSIRLSLRNRDYKLLSFNKWYIYLVVIACNILIFLYPMQYFSTNLARYRHIGWISRSMSPTINMNETVIIDSWIYKNSSIKRGDLIVFESPERSAFAYPNIIKRCVAIPGDKVEIKEGQLYVNDKVVNEDYLLSPEESKLINYDVELEKLADYANRYDAEIVAENHYFCLGDNRYNSEDSRAYGAINRELIKGKVLYIFLANDNFIRKGKKVD